MCTTRWSSLGGGVICAVCCENCDCVVCLPAEYQDAIIEPALCA